MTDLLFDVLLPALWVVVFGASFMFFLAAVFGTVEGVDGAALEAWMFGTLTAVSFYASTGYERETEET